MKVIKHPENPILEPFAENFWEAEGVFNGSPIIKDGKTYFFYRAYSKMHYHAPGDVRLRISSIGLAESEDGVHFTNRRRVVVPEDPIDRFGAEDPRVVKVDDTYYIFYTALSTYPFGADGIKIAAITSNDLETFTHKRLITPFNAKAMSLFPERINGKLTGILSVNTDLPPEKMCIVTFENDSDLYSEDFWNNWYQNLDDHVVDLPRVDKDFVEVGATPLKTEYGWLKVYSHILNYYDGDSIFTIKAVLLDFEDPKKVVGFTKMPLVSVDEYYEKIGFVPDVVFPSGATIEDGKLRIYYGGADTFCCLAEVEFETLIDEMIGRNTFKPRFQRLSEEPIMSPIHDHEWERKAVFNPASIYLEGKFHILYRAMSDDNTSTMGYANSVDGVNIDYRCNYPVYVPREEFEKKWNPGGNSGCEDPRLVQMDDLIYMFYTAYNGVESPRIAMTTIKVNDFVKNEWKWSTPILISPAGMDNKDAFIFPEKFNDKYYVVHRYGKDMDLAFVSDLEFRNKVWLEEYRWIGTRKGWWDSKKVGASTPPIKTEIGWIMLYHGISEDNVYRLGAVLLDLNDPVKVLARTKDFLFEPEKDYELHGQVGNVVFPCGNVLLGDTLYIHYGGADSVINVASIKLEDLFRALK